MKRELDHLAALPAHGGRLRQGDRLHRPVLHRAEAEGADQASVRLRRRRLPQLPARSTTCIDHFKLNIETNHATLAGHTMQHELELRRQPGRARLDRRQHGRHAAGLGHRPVPDRHLPHHAVHATRSSSTAASPPGGVNFDAKVRRESFEPVDLFHAHIGGMDAFARGLKIAAAIRADGELEELAQASATPAGTAASARDRSRQARLRLARKVHARKRRSRPQPQRPAGDDRESHQYVRVAIDRGIMK